MEWSADLPATEDYQQRVERLRGAERFEAGLLFHHRQPRSEVFRAKQPVELQRILGQHAGDRDADPKWQRTKSKASSSTPIPASRWPNVDIKTWIRENNNQLSDGPTGKTDKNGMFSFDGPNQTEPPYCWRPWTTSNFRRTISTCINTNFNPRTTSQTIFFTDRSLYRPGQTIQYKGICIQRRSAERQLHTIANRAVTVIFQDPNGKEIARQQVVKSNDYGSFSGSFTAPRDRLAGNMVIRTEGEPRGATNIHVEEYKRPKFQVTLDAPKAAPKLNGKVSLQGNATAYTGAAIGEAKVTLSCRARDSLSDLVGLLLLVAAAEFQQPGNRPRHGS